MIVPDNSLHIVAVPTGSLNEFREQHILMIGGRVRRVSVSSRKSFHIWLLPIAGSWLAIAVWVSSAGAGPATKFLPWETRPPAFTLNTLAGAAIDLTDAQDSVVVVHFFATWCEPCREELPALDRLVGRLDHLTVLAVDSGEPEARITRFFNERPVSFPILIDADRAVQKAWGVYMLPTSFVIGRDGKPLWKAEGEVAWDSRPVADAIETAIASVPESFETTGKEEGEVE